MVHLTNLPGVHSRDTDDKTVRGKVLTLSFQWGEVEDEDEGRLYNLLCLQLISSCKTEWK